MATQIMRAASINNDGAFIDFTYDDVTRLCSRVDWANNQDKVVLVWATRSDGTAIISETRMAPHTSGSRNLGGGNRFNVDTEPGSLNLAG